MSNPTVVTKGETKDAPVDRRMTGSMRLTALMLAAGLPALVFFREGQDVLALACLVLGLLWGLGFYRKDELSSSIALVAFSGAGVFGILQRISPGWMLAGIVCALATWDLDSFYRRLSQVNSQEMARRLERAHLSQLGLVSGASLLAAGAILSIRFQLPFAVIVLVSLLAVYGLARLVGFLRRESD